MSCRNQLMNEGKPYPRSGCAICGSMFGGGARVCQMRVEPNPPAGSSLEPKHYIKTEAPNVEKYAVITEETYSTDDTYGGFDIKKYNKMTEFETEQQLIKWLADQQVSKYSKSNVVKIIKFSELQAETTVTVKLK